MSSPLHPSLEAEPPEETPVMSRVVTTLAADDNDDDLEELCRAKNRNAFNE
jgi:hypothetical protein